MNVLIEYHGSVEDNKLKIINRKMFIRDICRFNGMAVTITVKKKKKTRSNFQNRYYWGAVIPIVRQGLYDAGINFGIKQTHDLLKFRFLRDEQATNDGEIVEYIRSSKDLSTIEFMAYISQIQQWASEFLNVNIPDPKEQLNIDYDTAIN